MLSPLALQLNPQLRDDAPGAYPAWEPLPQFVDYGSYLDARGVEALEQHDLGYFWKLREQPNAFYCMRWIKGTGELILVGPNRNHPEDPDCIPEMQRQVQVIAMEVGSEQQLQTILTRGWGHACMNYRNSVQWVKDRVAQNRFKAAYREQERLSAAS